MKQNKRNTTTDTQKRDSKKQKNTNYITDKQHFFERERWVLDIRKIFTPKEMLNKDGTLNKDYFKPNFLTSKTEKKWTEKEKEALYTGISLYGIGNWKQIQTNCDLEEWLGSELSTKTRKIIGRQSLRLYNNWKGSKEDCEKEFKKNKEIGEKLGCWRGGVLVNDNNGEVEKEIINYNNKTDTKKTRSK